MKSWSTTKIEDFVDQYDPKAATVRNTGKKVAFVAAIFWVFASPFMFQENADSSYLIYGIVGISLGYWLGRKDGGRAMIQKLEDECTE